MTKEELEKSIQKKKFIIDQLNVQLAEFEKENTELKESSSVICDRLSERIDENIGLKNQLTKAKELLMFWVNDFYDNFNHSNKYEERHKAIVETEKFLKEE